MKGYSAIIFLVMLWAVNVFAAQPSLNNLLEQAEQHYNDGDFRTARAAYLQAIPQAAAQQRLHGGLFYNLGNCYYRLQQPALALLQYHRAHSLMGNDRDLLANMEIVANQLKLEQAQPPASALAKVFFWLPLLPLAMLWNICLAVYVMLGLLVVLRLHWPAALRPVWLSAVAILLLLAASLLVAWQEARRERGMVLDGNVELRSGRGSEFIATMSLPAGSTFDILEMQADWWKIDTRLLTAQGSQRASGFVPAAQVGRLATWQILRHKDLSTLFSKEYSLSGVDNGDIAHVK